MAHFPMGFFPVINIGELVYCFVFLYRAAAGPGPWATDKEYGAFCRL
jgi:putative oxidoreductase